MALTSEERGRRTSQGNYARLSPEHRRQRARVAALSRHHPDRPELADDARRQLQAAQADNRAWQAEQYIRDLVDGWPPLTDAQRGRLAALLTDSEGGDGRVP